MKHDVDGYLPLAPATLQILTALAGEDLHGHGIMQEVAPIRKDAKIARRGPWASRGLATPLLPADITRARAEIKRLEAVVVHTKLQLQPTKPRRS